MINIDYPKVFSKYLQILRNARNPKSKKPEFYDLGWNIVREQELFNFGGKQFEEARDMVDYAKKISILCIHELLSRLQTKKRLFNNLECIELKKEIPNICFVLQNIQTNELVIFKEIEESSFWQEKGVEPPLIQKFMKQNNSSTCKYIYLVYDYAYLQVVGHNDDQEDPGRGYQLYSLKWFFETYYGKEEYQTFYHALTDYIDFTNDILGYIVVRILTTNSMINFRKVIEREFLKFDYNVLLKKQVKNFHLTEFDFRLLTKYFLEEKNYLVGVGESNFSESLITAEWLYDSMKKAKAIDLTVIGMGYLKAIEQLLYHVICLHRGSDRKIKENYSKNSILLTQESIEKQAIDTTIGSMAIFFRDNIDTFRDELTPQAKNYIKELIFEFKNTRNGYFHKDNIHDWNIIEKIRIDTFCLTFLILGGQKLTSQNLKELGVPEPEEFSDFTKLCEFIHFYTGNLFFVKQGNHEDVYWGCSDMHMKIKNNKYIEYLNHS